jgi:hypothetical protein
MLVVFALGAVDIGPTHATVPAGVVPPAAVSAGSVGNVRADFNGDGYSDLAVGVPFEDVVNTDAGGVNVIYGGGNGFTSADDEFWSQDSPGIFGEPDSFDQFGFSVAAADFDYDGFTDLAVGVPFEDYIEDDSGGVHLIYGSASGLTSAGSQFLSQHDPEIIGEAENGDTFGYSLAAADFGKTAHADIAIGVRSEDYGVEAGIPTQGDGGVNVLYGASGGITTDGDQFWSQDSPDIFGDAHDGDHFGAVLTAGNLGHSGHSDLVVGAPDEDYIAEDAGGLHIIYGSVFGLTSASSQFWSQHEPAVYGDAEEGDHFGSVLAAGDFDGNSFDDLVVGVPAETYFAEHAGGVNVLYGSVGGIAAGGSQFWSQNHSGIPGDAEAGDLFGYAVAAADFDGDGTDDLAIGVPHDDAAAGSGGGVHVVYGTVTGLASTGNQFWDPGHPDFPEQAELGEQFGSSLAAADFGETFQADLAIGVPRKDVGDVRDSGGVHVLFGSMFGLTTGDNEFWSQDHAIAGDLGAEDQFGYCLTAGLG